MTDYTKLIERMRTDSAFDFTTLGNESADAIEALQKEVSTLDVLLEECKMDWSGDVTQLKAEHKHEIEALQAECAEHKENAMRNARIAVSIRAERDQLQSKLGDAIQSSAHWQHQFTEAQAENERLNSGWHQANQEALQAKLTVQVQAKNIVLLCDDLKYIAGIARRLGMPVDDDTLKVRAAILGAVQNLEAERNALQAKLDAMGKVEPVAWQFRTNGKHWHVVQVCPPDDAYDKGTLSPLYAAPKALAPTTWQPASNPPPESAGEVLVRMADGRCEIAWPTYWHGSSNAFAQWTFRDPDEDEQPVEWMTIPAHGIGGTP